MQKAALGLQDSDDEDAAVDIDEQIESMFNSKKRVKDMAAPGTSSVPAPTAGNAEKLEIAKRLALRINAQKNLGIESQVLSNLFRVLLSTFYVSTSEQIVVDIELVGI